MTSTVDIPIKFAEPGFLGLGLNTPTLLFFAIAAFAAVASIVLLVETQHMKQLNVASESTA